MNHLEGGRNLMTDQGSKPKPEIGRCYFTWENRTQFHTGSRHRCTMSGPHIRHHCRCGRYLCNPHSKSFVRELDLHERLTLESERWLAGCPPSFEWTTKDVLDFAEIVFNRILEEQRCQHVCD
jgi:hypothetical protein